MNLQQQLTQLKRQRLAELDHLHSTYLQTKRGLRRQLSPDRFVRKHLGTALGVALLGGFFLAPRPTARVLSRSEEQDQRPRRGSIMRHIVHLIKGGLGGFKDTVAAHQKEAGAPSEPEGGQSGKTQTVLRMILVSLLERIDLTRLMTEFLHNVTAGMSAGHSDGGNGQPPQVSVADVGTVKPDSHENLQSP